MTATTPLKTNNPETLVLHAGPRSDASTGAVTVPIVQSTSFQFRNTEHAANLFALKELGNIYSRIGNPTCDALEQKIAALEGGVAALAVSSGQAASAMAIQNLCRPGDNIVSSTDHKERFPNLNEPDPSYHGAIWTEAVKPMGPIAYIIRARCVLLRDMGMSMSPFNAFQFIQGLETLPLRMREHCRNAGAVALYLQKHPQVSRVIYAGLHEDPEQQRRAGKYLTGGFSGLVGFELKQGKEAGARFIDALKMFYHVANIGDSRSLAIHPASTTHSQLSAEDQLASGVTPGYVRLSVGIEHADDIIADLDQALRVATMAQTSRAA